MESHSGVTLLMLSGGPRSCYLLLDLLKTTGDRIYTHHVRLNARKHNSDAAAQSCQQIIDYCSLHYRPVGFSQSMLDYKSLSISGVELTCVAFEAGLAAQNLSMDVPHLTRCIIARVGTDGSDADLIPHLQNCYQAAAFPGDAPELLLMDVDRQTAMTNIPPAFRQLVK